MRILCVCLGNICRSPMAEGAIRKLALIADLDLEVDSAALGDWHIGNPPDPRGLRAASARGYDNSAQRARKIRVEDFYDFDLILGMDGMNMTRLWAMCPGDARAEVRIFHPDGVEIPDPYDGGPRDYEHALDLIEHSARHLIAQLRP